MQLKSPSTLGPLWAGWALTFATGCAVDVTPVREVDTHAQPLESENGVALINGIRVGNGVALINGMRTTNGVALINGVHPPQHVTALDSFDAVDDQTGLPASWPIADTVEGRSVLDYVVRCALPDGSSVTLHDSDGTPYTFDGVIGVAPEWEDEVCDRDCQQWVSACLLSHVNLTGQHVGIWLDAENEAIGWGSHPDYPREEGVYFGNLFAPVPYAFACKGVDAEVDPIEGRLCLGQDDCPYVDAAQGGTCEDICEVRPEGDGYTECKVGETTFDSVVTAFTH